MKLGLGLYRHQLNTEHYRFARQCGCTHLVIHLVDYFRSSRSNPPGDQPVGDDDGWGVAGDPDRLWTFEELAAIKQDIRAHDLELEAIENFDPAHWHDVLLDGPLKRQQIENLKTLIRNLGRAGIPVMGYNFSIAGVAGRIKGRFARGEAEAVGMEGPMDTPLPNGMVWNMVYDRNATPGIVPSATPEQLWSRLQYFLEELIPVAEAAGVTLAAHPDDPPLPNVRAQPRLVWQPQLYQRLIDLKPSPRNALEFCVGSVAEMRDGTCMTRWTPTVARESWLTSTCATSGAKCLPTGRHSLTRVTWTCCACSEYCERTSSTVSLSPITLRSCTAPRRGMRAWPTHWGICVRVFRHSDAIIEECPVPRHPTTVLLRSIPSEACSANDSVAWGLTPSSGDRQVFRSRVIYTDVHP